MTDPLNAPSAAESAVESAAQSAPESGLVAAATSAADWPEPEPQPISEAIAEAHEPEPAADPAPSAETPLAEDAGAAPVSAPATVEADPVIGSIEPAVDALPANTVQLLEKPAVPYPHDVAAPHPLDAVPAGTVTTIHPEQMLAVARPEAMVTARPIQANDPLRNLPAGSSVAKAVSGLSFITIPATNDRPAVTSVGTTISLALSGLWGWLVKEGHAAEEDVKAGIAKAEAAAKAVEGKVEAGAGRVLKVL